MQSDFDSNFVVHPSNSTSQSGPSGSFESNLAALHAQMRGEQERADASVAAVQASNNSHPPLGFTSQYPHGHRKSIPIFKLHPDLLWSVFMINADMLPVDVSDRRYCGQWDALNVTRRTSQVCKQWRDLAINSPSLWGRCIDLKRLNQKEPHWRNEVFRRTGESFLYIKGSITSLHLAVFFFALLDTSWERIRALKVELEPLDAIATDLRWGALHRPAPALKSFSLSFDDYIPYILCTPEVPIFAGRAPGLVKLVLDNVGVLFKVPSNQFFQVRHLEISGRFTIPALFEALSNMSRLEYLQVHQNPKTDTAPSLLPHITFPRLSHIDLASTLDSCLAMLEHIIAAPSTLITFCPNSSGLQIENLDDRLSSALSRFTSNFFNSHTVSELSMDAMASNFLFKCKADSAPSWNLPELFFNTESFAGQRLHPGIYSALFKVFTACQLTTLSIRLVPCNYTPMNADDMSFISSFSSVETLVTTPHFLDLLLAKSNDKCLFFPSLKTLKYISYSIVPPGLDTLRTFLFWRQDAGFPIELLIIKKSGRPSSEARQLFETFTGLAVIWVKHGMSNEEPWDREDAEVLARMTPAEGDGKDYLRFHSF